MLQTQLVKLAAPKTVSGATDDDSEIGHPRAGVLPPPLFSQISSPESIDDFDDPFDAKFSTRNHQMKKSFTETGNTETRFFWMIDQLSFRQLFRLYAKFGDPNRSGESITLTCSDKWLRQAKIIDNRKISTIDTGIYFKQVAKFRKALNMKSYETFLQLLARKKNLNFDELKYKLVTSGPPETKTTAFGGPSNRLPSTRTCTYGNSRRTKEVDNRYAAHRVTEIPRAARIQRRREPVKRTFEDFFSNCQCQHGYLSQISYSFPDDLHKTTDTQQRYEDWFPEE